MRDRIRLLAKLRGEKPGCFHCSLYKCAKGWCEKYKGWRDIPDEKVIDFGYDGLCCEDWR